MLPWARSNKLLFNWTLTKPMRSRTPRAFAYLDGSGTFEVVDVGGKTGRMVTGAVTVLVVGALGIGGITELIPCTTLLLSSTLSSFISFFEFSFRSSSAFDIFPFLCNTKFHPKTLTEDNTIFIS